ncbi:MAG TPA: ATP-binding protein [Polyangiaceae bacterium]|nr:ATP-binding protein [Polyangiaceae bacterium]
MDQSDEPIPESEGNVEVLVLVPTSVAADRIATALADRYAAHSLHFEVTDGPSAELVSRIRQRIGGTPLGFVAVDEVAALAALSQGADEVLVWPPGDDRAIHGFFDRTLLRASLRKVQERASAAMAHTEKLSALGTLVAGVAHEINNPLMALQLSIEACISSLSPISKAMDELEGWLGRGFGATPAQIKDLVERSRTGAPSIEAKQLLEEMLVASSAIGSVVRDLRVFARADNDREEAQILDANEVVDQALRLVGREIAMVAHIERDYSRELPRVVVPHGRLTQVLVNILINAAHAINDVERPVHRVRITTRADAEYVAISISDTGPGIAASALSHIFDPFFTTKRTGLGTGLGLSISRSIMRDLGGDLIVESVHGAGATFIALLPLPDHAALRNAYLKNRVIASRKAPRERRTVLVVESDERILKAYARMLASSCDVILASDAQEAIELLSSGSNADSLLTELSLPDMDGRLFFAWLSRERPELAKRTVFVSAEAALERHAEFLGQIDNTVLTKPATAKELWAALDALAPTGTRSSRPPPRE